MNVLDLWVRGGWIMWPIGLCSIIALGLFLERFWGTRRSTVTPPNLQMNVESLLARGLLKQAVELCQGSASSLGRVLCAGIRLFSAEGAPVTRPEVKDAFEAAGRREAEDLRRFVGGISTIATVAPLLGLLGTVWGMVETFQVIEEADTVSKATMAGGIWKALLTTVAGLIVAIPTVIAHRVVTSRVTDRVIELETGAERAAELLLRPEAASSSEPEADG
jgi:biopolymer transport protein ExbB